MTKDYVKFVNKENLKTARENMGLDVFAVSKKFTKTKKNPVEEWETGQDLPTWKQIEKLAKLYNVSQFVFFTNEILQKNKEIPDYRVEVKELNNEKISKLINFVVTRQKWLEKNLQDDRASKNTLVGLGNKINNAKELATLISNKLEINVEHIKKFSGNDAKKKTIQYLTQQAESKGIFVGKTISYHKIEVEEMRGLSISNDYCPFIVINRRDAESAQIFSLVHEFAHVFRKSDAISNSLEFRKEKSSFNPEELLCNKVAAELLLPEKDFVQSYYTLEGLGSLVSVYKVSKLTLLYRLKELGKIQNDKFSEWERIIKDETARNLKAKKDREKNNKGGNYLNSMKDSNGALFNSIVAGAYFENRIGYVEAASLLKYSPEKA